MNRNLYPRESYAYRLPEPPAARITSAGFMACPVVLIQGLAPAQQAWQHSLYQLAFEQVQAELRPSLPERDLLAVWN